MNVGKAMLLLDVACLAAGAASAQTTNVYNANFAVQDFLSYNPSVGWPPGEGKAGPQYAQMWSTILYNGWPTNSGSQDDSACNQGGSKDAQCYNPLSVAATPMGYVLNSQNTPSSLFSNLLWSSGEIISNPNFYFTYGYFQATLWLPGGPGFNRAMVLYSADIDAGWPWEIDPLQAIGLNAANQPSNSDLFFDVTNDNGTQTTSTWISNLAWTGWVNVGVEVGPVTTTFYFNNRQVFQAPTPANLISQPDIIVFFGTAVGLPDSWEGAPPNSAAATAGSINRSMDVHHFRWSPIASYPPGRPPFLPLL